MQAYTNHLRPRRWLPTHFLRKQELNILSCYLPLNYLIILYTVYLTPTESLNMCDIQTIIAGEYRENYSSSPIYDKDLKNAKEL